MPDLDPIDKSVTLPASVTRAAAAAEAAHKAAYAPDPTPAVVPPVVPPAASAVVPPASVPSVPPARAVADSGEPGSWEHRYHAMEGRYKQTQNTVGQMQEQMSQLGDELLATQRLLRTPTERSPVPDAAAKSTAPKLVTKADFDTYGPELLDLVARAAREAVAPDLATLDQRTRQVNTKVQQTAAVTLHQQLEGAIPNWQEINLNPAFKLWCSLRDVYSGRLRSQMLQDAYQAADAPRVVAFFKGFLAEGQATGQIPVPQPQPVLPEPPRQAAISLELLASPGRAKPASGIIPGDTADKPIITRGQVVEFYSNVRKGAYVGRDKDKADHEAIIFAAQRDGRIR